MHAARQVRAWFGACRDRMGVLARAFKDVVEIAIFVDREIPGLILCACVMVFWLHTDHPPRVHDVLCTR